MLFYSLKRILSSLIALLFLASFTFFLLRMIPGGPFDSDQKWPPEVQANIAKLYELDLPIEVQFLHWARDLAHGNLRESFQYLGKPVTELISETLPVSALVGGLALFLALISGILLGSFAAWKRGTWIDTLITAISVTGFSLPSYLLASLLILFFSLKLGWLPSALWEGPSSLVLPVITLGWRPMGMISRLIRTSMLESLGSDYIRTALGKGLTWKRILFKHALRNSLIPTVSLLGPISANLLTGSFLVEVIFQLPGLGKHFVQAVLNRDYPFVMGITLVYGVIFISLNILTDLLYGWIDPRVRVGAT